MEDITKKKLFAAAKIGGGAARIGSGVAAIFGHGLLGVITKRPGGIQVAAPFLKRQFIGGKDMIQQGIAEWKDASS